MRQDKSLQQTKESSKQGLLGYILAGVAISLATLVVVGYWLMVSVVAGVNQQHQQELIDVYTRQYQTFFNTTLNQQEQYLQRLAESEQMIELMNERDMFALNTLAEQLSFQLPGAMKVWLFPTGYAAQDSNANPPLNFAGLDMIRRAEQDKLVPMEALQFQDQLYLQQVKVVKRGERILGSISVSLSLDALRAPLRDIDAGAGNIKLEQKHETAAPQMLFQQGAPSTNERIEIQTNIPNWHLSFQPSDRLAKATLLDPMMILIPLVVVGVIMVVALIMAATMLQKAIRQDAGNFTRYTQKLLSGQPTSAPDFRLGLFVSMTKSLARVKIRPRPGGRSGEVTNPFNQPVDPSVSESVSQGLGSTTPHEELFGIDMIDEDQDLLGMDMDEEQSDNTVMSLPVSESIFRAYDIRGIYGETLDAGVAYKIGQAIGSEAYERGEQTIIVGRDGRVSSPEAAKALISGMLATGRDVIDLGIVPTPLVYYATHVLGVASGVMVTGSHNPPTHNGFKIVLAGQTISGDEIKGLYHRINNANFLTGKGSLSQQEIVNNYINRVSGDIKLKRKLKVVLDAGNGVAGVVAPRLFQALGCDIIPMYCDVDGRFPNHHPDPSQPKNLVDLIAEVNKQGADLGLAFDGDGDRVGIVTNSGESVYADRMLMLLAKDLLSRNKGATIIYDVKCTRRLQGLIVGYGGRPLMWKTGHSLIKKKMKETGALLAGEMSGHVFFKERWYGFDDGLYTGARLVEILSNDTKSLDELFAIFPTDISTPELNVDVPDSEKFHLMERMARNAVFPDGNLSTIDGVRVDFPDGWGLVRASNTTAKLVFRFEADNESALKRIQEAFRQQLLSIDSSLQFPF